MRTSPLVATAEDPVLTPLRFPVIPYADESLPGLVARATREHVLEMTSVVLRRAGLRISEPAAICQAPAEDLDRLAQVLRCEREDLCDRTHRYFPNAWRRGPVSFGAAVVYREDILLDRRRISPLTLQTSEHHRAAWLLGLLPYCPLSLERLVDECPNCPGKKLGWRRSWGIANCERCGELVPPSSAAPLIPEHIENYRLFADLISFSPERRRLALAQVPAEVQALQPQTLLNCVIRLGAICRPDPVVWLKRNAVKSLPSDLLVSVVTNGTAMLRNWPQSLKNWSQDEFDRLAPDYSAIRKSRHTIKVMARDNVLHPQQKQFFQMALPEIFEGLTHSIADSEETIPGKEVARIAALEMREVRALCDAGILAFGFERGTSETRKKFLKWQAEELGSCLRGAVYATQLETKLGLPLYAIEQLCCLGIIDQERHLGVLHLRPDLMIKRSSSEVLYSRLETTAQPSPTGPGTAPLGTAARRVGGRMKPWGAIVAALLDGSIPYWLASGPNYARRIRVRRADMARFDQTDFFEADYPGFAFSQYLVRRDADEILNFDPNQSRELLKLELLKFHRSATSLKSDRADVLMLAQRIISPAELSERSGRSSQSVVVELKRFNIPRIAFGWDRRVISKMQQFAEIL